MVSEGFKGVTELTLKNTLVPIPACIGREAGIQTGQVAGHTYPSFTHTFVDNLRVSSQARLWSGEVSDMLNLRRAQQII